MPAKMWWRSKTIWVNLLMAVAVIGAGIFKVELPPEAVVIVEVVVNLILRLITEKPIV